MISKSESQIYFESHKRCIATMLNGQCKEETQVEIKNASSAAFVKILQFLCLANVEILSENVGIVAYLPSK